MLSETCKDLLRRLLQRNPADRISFVEFFTHPFVDLEHMASADSLTKAVGFLFVCYCCQTYIFLINNLLFNKKKNIENQPKKTCQTELLSRAVRFDQSGECLLAQKYYLQSIEYLIPAIQCKIFKSKNKTSNSHLIFCLSSIFIKIYYR